MRADACQRVLILDAGLASFRTIGYTQRAIMEWTELMKKLVPAWRTMIARYQKIAKKRRIFDVNARIFSIFCHRACLNCLRILDIKL